MAGLMMAAVYALAGMALGSFAGCAGYRLAEGGSVLSPARSRCPDCGHVLAWFEVVPVLSWVALRGRCRHCGLPVSPRYPLTEAVMGAAGLALGLRGVPPVPALAALAAFLVPVTGVVFGRQAGVLPRSVWLAVVLLPVLPLLPF